MATTPVIYASAATAVSGSWVSLNNAVGSGVSSYAYWEDTTAFSVGTIGLTYNIASLNIPAGSTIDSVNLSVKAFKSASALATTISVNNTSGTLLDAEKNLGITNNQSMVVQVPMTGVTYDELTNNFQVRVIATRPNTTSSMRISVDYVGLSVNYTEPVAPSNGILVRSGGTWLPAKVRRSGSWV